MFNQIREFILAVSLLLFQNHRTCAYTLLILYHSLLWPLNYSLIELQFLIPLSTSPHHRRGREYYMRCRCLYKNVNDWFFNHWSWKFAKKPFTLIYVVPITNIVHGFVNPTSFFQVKYFHCHPPTLFIMVLQTTVKKLKHWSELII